MRTLMKSLGGVILLVGVGILIVPALKDIHDNVILFGGLIIIIIGFIVHIILNKVFE